MKIFKKPDGGVIISNFVTNKIAGDIVGLDGVEIEESDLPPHEYHEQLHFDGPCAKENLKVDRAWNVQIMPECLIKEKHLKKLDAKIDAELEKENPDPVELARLQRKKEKAKGYCSKEWLQQAMANLDARVEGGEPDKPLIRQKLQAKLNEN